VLAVVVEPKQSCDLINNLFELTYKMGEVELALNGIGTVKGVNKDKTIIKIKTL